MRTQFLAALALASAVGACSTVESGVPAPAPVVRPLTPIASLDVRRFMGGWYEIAKYPNWFQRTCVADTRAEYRLADNGAVEVLNRCRNRAGATDQAVGVARRVGPGASARLEVRFAPDWLAFVPFLWADYWVIDIDDGYRLAAVSEPRREYLWILSRTPRVDEAALDALLSRLAQQGFGLGRLERTAQSN